jgi:hypothetical protein
MQQVLFGRPIQPTAADTGCSAPPARQAATSRLAGKPAPIGRYGADDLPLTAFVRRHANGIEAATLVVALTAIAAFGLPFLLLLGR